MADQIDLTLVRKANEALRAGNFHAALTYLRDFLIDAPPVITEEENLARARSTMRQNYYTSVEHAAKNIFDDYCSGSFAGSRETLEEVIGNNADGQVTYTSDAQECLLFSNNDTAGIDELGADGFDWKSGVPWSQLAYFAFQADLRKELEDLGIDLNEDPPEQDEVAVKCDQCGKIKVAVKGETTCNACQEELGNEQCSECDSWYDPDHLLDGVCEECREPKTQEGEDPRGAGRSQGVP